MSDLITLTLPDGSAREVVRGTTAAQVAASIGPGLAKAALAARIDGELRDLSRPILNDASLALITVRDEAVALELARHDYAHVLAEAVQHLHPGTQITFGPSTDDGFYYDFAPLRPFTDDDLPAIEAEMRAVIARDTPLVREEWPRDQLIAHFAAHGETFKAEWAAEKADDEVLSVYRAGNAEDSWLDMCRGPHLPSTGKLDPNAFKLTRVSGAYWRGDQANAMLSRIYGTGWLNKKQLDAHLVQLEEAAKRDHRRIGQDMDLFHLQPEAQGSVFWHPKGFVLWRALEAYMRRRLDHGGYREVKTPQLMAARQWEQSGHWGKYRENMFVVPDEIPSTDDDAAAIFSGTADLLALKPMNCPAHVLIFRQGIKSYRDLPIRMAEFGCCHRNEPHGALHGIMRVRQFTQDDAHIFCTAEQLTKEVRIFCDLLDVVYKDLGFDGYAIKLALRPDKRFGSEEMWDWSEQSLRDAVRATGRDTPEFGWEELPGEGAFYAPKLEFHLTDAIGRTWQVGTIQTDTVLPERLDASYVGEDGERHRPIMLHRAILGSFERFIGILIEHHAGRFPLWLAPVQAVVATIVSDADDYAGTVAAALAKAGLRVETDLRNEKINYKVREHSLAKVPHLIVVGRREAEEGTVALRPLGGGEQVVLSLAEAVARLTGEAVPPDLR